jgi:chaperone required for assembly of F1-ATPase
MAKKGKLLAAIDRHKGRNIRLEKQRAQEKAAARRRVQAEPERANNAEDEVTEEWEDEDGEEGEEDGGVALELAGAASKSPAGVSLKVRTELRCMEVTAYTRPRNNYSAS